MAEGDVTLHVVRAGETIPGISAAALNECFGKPRTAADWAKRSQQIAAETQAIATINGIKDPNLLISGNSDRTLGPLESGQVLVIPDPETLFHKVN